MMKKYYVNIDGREIQACAGQTILEAARENGIFIPTLCADGRTEIYGACGVCVVEAEGNPKLLKACATELSDGMAVRTDTPRVIASRRTMLELLLSDHTGDCRAPCLHACPAHTDCQGYVGLVANGRYEEAYRLIMERIPMPASIGRVCPHPCETECRRGLVEEPIGIARIKRFCGDFALAGMGSDAGSGVAARLAAKWLPEIAEDTGKRVAIIGGGPYGLSLAYFLRRFGHGATIYEAMPKAGGMLRYGIPEYRLPKAVLDAEIALLESMGIEIQTGRRVGQDISFDSIRAGYDAVCLGVGAWTSTGTGAKGEGLPGVIGGIELLCKVAGGEDVFLGRRVAVVGGGNTAMDACRTAVRLGAREVYNIYRRTKDEMPADRIEIDEAEEEGVVFKTLANPLEIIPGTGGRVSKIILQAMELGEPDASGRRAPVPVKGKTETLAVDTVVLAVGQAPDPAALGIGGLELTRKKGVVYDRGTFMTSLPGVFAGGDCGNDKVSIAVEAIADAKHSSGVIDAYLSGEEIAYRPDYSVTRGDITERSFEGRERLFRPPAETLLPAARKQGFAEVSAGWDAASAAEEGARCLECGCGDYFECKLIEYARLYDVDPARFGGDVSAAAEDGSLALPGLDADGHPFIEREEGKCILCGLCVRVCGEVAGAAALGMAGRGFDTAVTPAFGVPLAASGCVSCGLCVDACPTGALREKLSLRKPVPLETAATETVCPHCSVGCGISLETYGGLLVKANPPGAREGAAHGLICGRGKFGFDGASPGLAGTGESLSAPLVRDGVSGALETASWYAAFVSSAKKAQGVRAEYGPGSVAVAVSDRLTNEEAYAAGTLALSLGARLFSFNNRRSAASGVFGSPPQHHFEELLHTDYILAAGFDFGANPVVSMRLRQAAAAGVKIVFVETGAGGGASFGARIPAETVACANSLAFLNEVEAALCAEKAPAKAKRVAAGLRDAKKAMILYQRNVLTEEAAALLCRVALLSGHGGGPRDGVFELLPKCNSRGLCDLGIAATAADIQNSGYGSGVRALLVFGEDPAGQIAAAESKGPLPDELKAAKALLAQAQFLVVCDTHLTATAQTADVVLPAAGFAASDGTFTNAEGRMLAVHPAAKAPIPYANWQICKEIAAIAGAGKAWESEADISREMKGALPAYRHARDGAPPAQARQGTAAAKDAAGARRQADAPASPARGGKLVSPLPTSDHLTRMINRRLGTDVYGD
ncbi:MAG: FAD-dependent oxidoreductase [Clostridiales Family XIII bacterium]|jgi:formate dehydrogenase major subunit|nr:FAD-dependent oxidoreductase [Clostridiales Family XIII bacterium]